MIDMAHHIVIRSFVQNDREKHDRFGLKHGVGCTWAIRRRCCAGRTAGRGPYLVEVFTTTDAHIAGGELVSIACRFEGKIPCLRTGWHPAYRGEAVQRPSGRSRAIQTSRSATVSSNCVGRSCADATRRAGIGEGDAVWRGSLSAIVFDGQAVVCGVTDVQTGPCVLPGMAAGR